MKSRLSSHKKLIVQAAAASVVVLFALGLYIEPAAQAESIGSWTANSGAVTAALQSCVLDLNIATVFCVQDGSGVFYNTYSAGTVGGSWTSTTPVTTGNSFNYPWSCTSIGNVIYCVSRNPSGAGSCVAYYATMTSTGVSSWSSTNAPGSDYCTGGTYAGTTAHCGIYQSYEYCAGNGNPNTELTAASVGGSGFGTWSQSTQAIGVLIDGACTVSTSTGAIYCVGGDPGSTTASTLYCPVSGGAFGTCRSGSLYSADNYPYAVADAFCFTVVNYIYCVGGEDSGSNYRTDVYYAPVTAASIGPWVTTNSYPTAARDIACTVDSSEIITCYGGFDGSNIGNGYYSAISTGVSTTTSTTTINTGCTGSGCTGGSNGTANYLSSDYFYYYWSQNQASGAQVDNVTVKVGAVHINAATTTLYVLVYEAGNAAVPSASNPWNLVAPADAVPITNGTSNFFVHANPQNLICSSCYFAVGVMAISTASRGSGASGSGISLYESSTVGMVEYQYSVGSSTPAAAFYANNVKTNSHFDFMYIHTTYPVAIETTTVTSTTAINGTATSTVTATTTQTTIDSGFLTNNINFPIVMLLLFLPTGIFFGISKTISGALVGMLIGSVMLIVLVPSLAFLFTGLIIAIVALVFLVRERG
jgi:hypothetical protein